ncbi:MAG: peptide chain release factor N(5)-glutamine methyltransferase, partial [Candidatus Ratteibacteria bacterium]
KSIKIVDALNLIKKAKEELQKVGIESGQIEGEILLSSLLGIERYKIYTEKIFISEKIQKKFFKLIERRKRRIPLAYITKKIYFYNCEFMIEKGIFIPRPETELLVEKAINIYKEYFYPKQIRILDIGIGCGNIAITIAKNVENCIVSGVDISKKCLKIAHKNAILNKVEKKTKFLLSNIFDKINEKFEIIVSNPPYVSKIEYEKLEEEIKKEPKRALIGGKDGVKIIKKILRGSVFHLKKNGFLIIETGYNQVLEIKKIIPQALKLFSIEKDLSSFERIVVFKKI